MASRRRTRPVNRDDARARLNAGRAYLVAADLVLLKTQDPSMPGVAAGTAVLAGIAASDTICAVRLGEIHRGDDHRSAALLLASATPDGRRLAGTLRKLLDVKDEAHYGVTVVSRRKATDAVRWARLLVDRAIEELER